MFRQLGPAELTIILLIIVLLFGAKKLPETARGLGRSLRIFKAETKGLRDDEDDATPQPAPREVESARPASQPSAAQPAVEPVTGGEPVAGPESERSDR